VASVNPAGTATGLASGSTKFTASLSGSTGNAALTITVPASAAANVVTWHFDDHRSGVASGDMPGYGIKFTSPIVANGKVYISTGRDPASVSTPQGELDVYGLK
jgi:hypothetical protein